MREIKFSMVKLISSLKKFREVTNSDLKLKLVLLKKKNNKIKRGKRLNLCEQESPIHFIW